MNVKLKHGLWVIVADGEKALFLRNKGDNKFPNLEVVQEMEQENPATREQGTDKPGRQSNEGPRSAVEETDWHRLGKERFGRGAVFGLQRLRHEASGQGWSVQFTPWGLGRRRRAA